MKLNISNLDPALEGFLSKIKKWFIFKKEIVSKNIKWYNKIYSKVDKVMRTLNSKTDDASRERYNRLLKIRNKAKNRVSVLKLLLLKFK